MAIGMRMSQKLEQRQDMIHRLEQAMRIERRMVMEMGLYQRREDHLKKAYATALKRGDVRQYDQHELKFEYARIRRREVPAEWAATDSCGFAHCLYSSWNALFFGHKIALASGSWLLFVVTDHFQKLLFPEEYMRYVAVHEHGEEMTLGEHSLATKLEFAISLTEKRITPYIQFLADHYPTKFTDVFSRQTNIVLPDSEDFRRMLELKSKADYAQSVRKMIEGFEWPRDILQKLNLYERRSHEAENAIVQGCLAIGRLAKEMPIERSIPDVLAILTQTMTAYLRHARNSSRYFCWPRVQEKYQDARASMFEGFDQYRIKREGLLKDRHGPDQGQAAYFQEIAAAGDNKILMDGVFSPLLKDAIAAVV